MYGVGSSVMKRLFVEIDHLIVAHHRWFSQVFRHRGRRFGIILDEPKGEIARDAEKSAKRF